MVGLNQKPLQVLVHFATLELACVASDGPKQLIQVEVKGAVEEVLFSRFKYESNTSLQCDLPELWLSDLQVA